MEGWTLYSLALWGGALALASAAAWMLWRKLGAELGFSHSVSTGKRGLRVVITGGSRGIGLALAREFVQLGDKVCIVGRNGAALDKAAKELSTTEGAVVRGAVADITSASDVKAMMESAVAALGGVDIVVHNAGAAQPVNAPLTDTPAADIESVLRVNCLGSLLVSREAIATMSASGGGHLFLMDGAGSDGMTTPSFATYGFSKAGLPQLIRTLNRECQGRGVVVHGMSPGMVLTSLLLRRPTKRTLWLFNVLAEMPSTVARWLVPRIRGGAVLPVPVGKEARLSTYSKFLTTTSAALRFLSVVLGRTKNRLIDTESGEVRSPEYGCPDRVDVIEAPKARAA